MPPMPDSSPPTLSTMSSVKQQHQQHHHPKRSVGTNNQSHYVSPAFLHPGRTTTTTTTTTTQRRIPPSSSTTTTTMVPNTSDYSFTNDQRSSITTLEATATTAIHAPRDDERPQRRTNDLLNDIPPPYSPSYLPLPLPLKITIITVSLLLSTLSTHRRRRSLPSSSSSTHLLLLLFRHYSKILIRTTLLALLSTTCIQDLFYPPSRLPLSTMHSLPILPSRLSHVANVTMIPSAPPLAIHYLRHVNPSSLSFQKKYDALYLNHGFGASSLSFLPSLIPLVDRLKCRVGLGHDAVGFGLTERPLFTERRREREYYYSSVGSSSIGGELLRRELSLDDGGERRRRKKRVCFVGHSLGSLATLRMVLDFATTTTDDDDGECDVVLVAPALRGSPKEWQQFLMTGGGEGKGVVGMMEGEEGMKKREGLERVVNGLMMPFYRTWRVLRYLLFDVPFCYLLRRLVSPASFWQNGLSSAFHNPDRLTPDTVLRYRWPSLSRGWERGILSFVRAQLNKQFNYPFGGDWGLLRQVLLLTTSSSSSSSSSSTKVKRVVIIHGREDRIVPLGMSETLGRFFPGLTVRVMDGVGHNPFEEDVERFVDVVEECLGGGVMNEEE